MKSGSAAALLLLGVVIVVGMIAFARNPGAELPNQAVPIGPQEGSAEGDGAVDPGFPESGPTELQPDTGTTERATATPSEEDLGSGTLRVLAVDAITGEPVRRYWMKRDSVADLTSQDRPLLSEPKTGTLTLSAEQWDGESSEAVCSFLVSSPHHTPLSVMLDRPRRDGQKQRIELQRAASIVGTVRDGSSAPLVSARVSLEYHGAALEFTGELGDAKPFPDSYHGPTLRLTDAAGEYAFGQLPPGIYRTLVEQASARHGSDPITVRPGEWSLGDHWLDEHVRLTVTVCKEDGTVAPKTRLLLVEATPPLAPVLGEKIVLTANQYSDTDGRSTFGPLAVGDYALYFQSDDGFAAPIACKVSETSRSLLELTVNLKSSEAR